MSTRFFSPCFLAACLSSAPCPWQVRSRANCPDRFLGALNVTRSGGAAVSCPNPAPASYPNQQGYLTAWALERLPEPVLLAPPSPRPPPPR